LFFKKNYFLKKTILDKIRHIPITIVQGLYDMECPFITAYKLHKALPHANFYPTLAGHSAHDPPNTKCLVEATNDALR
jgi:proline iminopeptidase